MRLGGNIGIPDVCAACNSGFSPIDQALAERSPVTFTRLVDTPASAFEAKLGSRTTIRDGNGTVVEVTVKNGYETVVLPQLHMRTDASVSYSAPDQDQSNKLLAYIDMLVSTSTLGDLRTVEDPDAGTTAIILHRSKDGYLRVPTMKHRDWFIEQMTKLWTTEIRSLLTAQALASVSTSPELAISFVCDPNTISRAVAKNALNTLCLARDASLALRPELDALRDYIKGDVRLPTEARPGTIAVDTRFVTPVLPEQQVLSFGPDHTIIFIYQRPRLRAYITLYARHQYIVTFPDIDYVEKEPLFGHYFSVDRTSNRRLTETEIATLLLQARPNLLGPDTGAALALLQSIK